jgi:hypothetical protein
LLFLTAFFLPLQKSMKVVGFSFIKNAVEFDYPIVEAISSILPLCDEFVVAVGNSSDKTRELIESIDQKKIKIIDTIWNDNLREGGKVLADETNKALNAIDDDTTWCFYIQGDEVIHEKYLPAIEKAMKEYENDEKVEGLLFNYTHFYGSYDFIGASRRWYRREIRIIRKNKNIFSYKDAQGFRMKTSNEDTIGRKLNVRLINATVYHYGWVKNPFFQQKKQEYFNRLWHDEQWMEKNVAKVEEFDYSKIDALKRFTGSHPQVMKARIERVNWSFDFDPTKKHFSLKQRFLSWFESVFHIRLFEYKNYRIIK